MATLAVKHRPKDFKTLSGQKHARLFLKNMILAETVPSALILTGIRGTGKTTIARIIAAALNCEERTDENPCTSCPSCKSIQNSCSLDVLEIDAASNGLVADIRKIKDMVAYSQNGAYRVVILDEAHNISREGFNALLKVLEEPPSNTLFIMCTTEPGKIIDTVQSRSMRLDFRRIPDDLIADRLHFIAEEENILVEDALITEIVSRVEGGMRDGIMLLEQAHRMGLHTADELKDALGINEFGIQVLLAIANGNPQQAMSYVEEAYQNTGDVTSLTEDVGKALINICKIKAGLPIEDPELCRLAASVDMGAVLSWTKVLWTVRDRVRATESNTLQSMQLACILLSDAVKGRTASAPTPQPEKPLSLAEMQRMR